MNETLKNGFGMGSLSGGMLQVKLNGKSFGVLGQGSSLRDSNGNIIANGDAMNGFTISYEN